MKVHSFIRYAFGIAAGVTLLSACSANGTTPSLGGNSAASQSVGGFRHSVQELNRNFAMTNPQGKGLPAARQRLTRSWFENAPKGTTGTLWATDSEYASVDMIAYPSGKLVGQVSGFEYPGGDCSDKSGNVYVADFDAEKGYEINSSGSVVNSWSTGGETYGCSVAPNGDVAFTNFYPGGVKIVAGPDAGASYPGPAYDWSAGYDAHGNLFVECAYASPCSSVSLYEWPAGGSAWQHVSFKQTISFGAPVQNMGKYLGVGDQEVNGNPSAGIYLATVSGSQAKVVKTIVFSGGGCYPGLSSGWGSINNKPNGVVTKTVKDIALPSGGCGSGAIAIYKAKNGQFLKSLGPANEYDAGVTFTKP